MSRGPELTKAARAIAYACTIACMDEKEVNDILAEAGFPPTKNYKELTGLYRRYFIQDLSRLGPAIKNPPTRAKAAAAIKAHGETVPPGCK